MGSNPVSLSHLSLEASSLKGVRPEYRLFIYLFIASCACCLDWRQPAPQRREATIISSCGGTVPRPGGCRPSWSTNRIGTQPGGGSTPPPHHPRSPLLLATAHPPMLSASRGLNYLSGLFRYNWPVETASRLTDSKSSTYMRATRASLSSLLVH